MGACPSPPDRYPFFRGVNWWRGRESKSGLVLAQCDPGWPYLALYVRKNVLVQRASWPYIALRGPRPPSAKHDVSTTTGTGTETACHERDAVACPIRTRGEARNRWTDRDSSEEKIGGGGGNRKREPEVPIAPYSPAIARNAAEELGQAEARGVWKHARVRIWRCTSANPCHGVEATPRLEDPSGSDLTASAFTSPIPAVPTWPQYVHQAIDVGRKSNRAGDGGASLHPRP